MKRVSKTTRRANISRGRLAVQRLESRKLMAADIGLTDSVLSIQGSDQNDIAEVYVESDRVHVKVSSFDEACQKTNERSEEFAVDDVGRIVFSAGNGDDLFVNDSSIPAVVRGGNGNDMLLGGTEADVLIGGAGDDIILGGGGDDTILGGPGENVFLDVEMDILDRPASESVLEEPIAEEPVAEEPVAESLAAEQPVAEEPVEEASVSEEIVPEELVIEASDADALETIAAEEHRADDPLVDDPLADDQVVMDEDVADPVDGVAIAPNEAVDEVIAEPIDEVEADGGELVAVDQPMEPIGVDANSEDVHDCMIAGEIVEGDDVDTTSENTELVKLSGEATEEPTSEMTDFHAVDQDASSFAAAVEAAIVTELEAPSEAISEESSIDKQTDDVVTNESPVVMGDLVETEDVVSSDPIEPAAPLNESSDADDTAVISDTEIIEASTTASAGESDESEEESDHDIIFGGAGDDWLMGEGGNDMIFGGVSPVEDALLREVIAGRFRL